MSSGISTGAGAVGAAALKFTERIATVSVPRLVLSDTRRLIRNDASFETIRASPPSRNVAPLPVIAWKLGAVGANAASASKVQPDQRPSPATTRAPGASVTVSSK